uniref:Uncharacterized protein n=1 Tax=Rhizophora mucronata TaxID=61149 RepID=A0A2P2IN94_RHIMU
MVASSLFLMSFLLLALNLHFGESHSVYITDVEGCHAKLITMP